MYDTIKKSRGDNNMNITKTIRIIQLPMVTQKEIERDIKNALADQVDDYFELLEEALDGRLCDLEDLIDINKYLV